MAQHDPGNEFSRLIEVKDIGERPVSQKIEAKPQELKALAQRFGLIDLAALTAELTLFWRGDEVMVEGQLEAEAKQRCVVSLAEVPARVESAFALVYRESVERDGRHEQEIDPETDVEPPEPFGPQGIDIGEAVAQQLSLALDPYPRHPEAPEPKRDWGAAPLPEEEEDAQSNPFAVLKNLKREN